MKTIIEMAREAGFNVEKGFLLWVTGIDEDLERFAALVRADEREACAKVCEEINDGTPYNLTEECATAIRQRSLTPCTHEWIDATTTKPQWHCAKCGEEYTKEKA